VPPDLGAEELRAALALVRDASGEEAAAARRRIAVAREAGLRAAGTGT
jgi:hypothetical protein